MGTAEMNPCLILGGGRIENYEAIKPLLPRDLFVICADSGFSHCGKLGVEPSLLVGDFDSLRQPFPAGVPRVEFQAEKDSTDTAIAVEEALARGKNRLILAGMLGGRLDHTLANLQLLAGLSQQGVETLITDGLTEIRAITNGSITLQPKERHYFSLFPYCGPCHGVTIRGAKYLLDRYDLDPCVPLAVSNEFTGVPAQIQVEQGTLLVMVVPMED